MAKAVDMAFPRLFNHIVIGDVFFRRRSRCFFFSLLFFKRSTIDSNVLQGTSDTLTSFSGTLSTFFDKVCHISVSLATFSRPEKASENPLLLRWKDHSCSRCVRPCRYALSFVGQCSWWIGCRQCSVFEPGDIPIRPNRNHNLPLLRLRWG